MRLPFAAEKDGNILLRILKDPTDSVVDFVQVYNRPMYVIRNMEGKPINLLRLSYPDDDDVYYSV